MQLRLDLHSAQQKVFRHPARAKVVCAGRGLGKSRLLLTKAIVKCLSYQGVIDPVSPQVALITMPTLKMARSIHWQPLLNVLEKCPLVENVNRSDFRISFKGNRPDLLIRGADNGGDRLRGLNLIWAGLDEYQDFNPTVWSEVLFPALARNADWEALIIGTPKGRQSHFYKLHEQALKTKGWQYFHFVTADNPFFPREHLERARQELPPKVYRQEFEASWEDFDGQLLDQLRRDHIATPPGNYRSVYIGVDWGDVNPAVLVIGLSHQGVYYLLDHWRNETGQPVTEQQLLDKAAHLSREHNVYRCYLPDDRPASVLSFRRHGKAHSVKGLQRAVEVKRSKPGPMERATILNSLLYQNRLYLTPKTEELYDVFASYHRAKDKDGNLLNKPADGQDDHPIDAAAYCIATLEFNHGDSVLAKAA